MSETISRRTDDDVLEELQAFAHVESLDALVAETDKVYEKDGRFFKVRVVSKSPPPGAPSFGMLCFEISGAHCDADGWTLPHGENGYQIAPSQSFTVLCDRPVDLAKALEARRLEAAAMTERAVLLDEAAQAL